MNKVLWKEEHLDFKHLEDYDWCPLCQARKLGQPGIDLGIVVGEVINNKDHFGR